MSRPIIEVRNLSKHYRLGAIGATSLRDEFHRTWDRLRGRHPADPREFWALRDVSFEVQPGEVVGIIGRNGAGKSTLLKILSRITEPTSGRVTMRGRVASLLEVGTGFHPELSGRDNVYLNGAILGMTRAEVRRKFDEIVAFAEVEKFIDTPVKRYSSGMYVRLAFAVAAHLEPEILIVDEVLAVGDAKFQTKCMGRMNSVASEGRTVLFVSHRTPALLELCHNGVLFDGGRVTRVGPIHEVVHHYITRLHEAPRQTFDGVIRHVRCSKSVAYGTGFWVELDVELPSSVQSPHYRATIYMETGEPVANTGSHLCPNGFPLLRGRVTVRLDFPFLPLVPGHYHVNVAVCEGESGHPVIERIERAVSFQMNGPSPYTKGRWPDVGVLALAHTWSVSPTAAARVLP